ncbi:NUDIX hydrolase [Nocardioides limicola]|uniref:NUDIX hydrolase n=1 Tax=Nocardioides limicola TaxID=2803368 RepID=UPI0027DBB1FF|nr:NUDIX hydrolase [Nocardioides sp. DJM-14]
MTSPAPTPAITSLGDGVARIEAPQPGEDWVAAVGELRLVVEAALRDFERVEMLTPTDDPIVHRVAAWAGLFREGIVRGGVRTADSRADRVLFARLRTDPAPDTPDGFRGLLNSFLPRKRGISQLLLRDPADRVLLCQLTYKPDWDLPGGVVEVGESPQLAAGREVGEELAIDVKSGRLLLTDWLPPWGGWDDAICLVFDGGVHDPDLVDRAVRDEREIKAIRFATVAEVQELCSDYTARRVEAALAAANDPDAPSYTESGRG